MTPQPNPIGDLLAALEPRLDAMVAAAVAKYAPTLLPGETAAAPVDTDAGTETTEPAGVETTPAVQGSPDDALVAPAAPVDAGGPTGPTGPTGPVDTTTAAPVDTDAGTETTEPAGVETTPAVQGSPDDALVAPAAPVDATAPAPDAGAPGATEAPPAPDGSSLPAELGHAAKVAVDDLIARLNLSNVTHVVDTVVGWIADHVPELLSKL